MIAYLNLIGKNELLLFAMIHGYTKDGKSTCRVSLKHMMEWLKTSKSAVIRTLNDLEEAGYINRYKYKKGKVECVEYTTNYKELLRRAASGEYISLESAKKARGLKMRPTTECAPFEGSQNDTGLTLITKGSHFDNERGLIVRPNNKYIINYNNFSCGEPRQQEEEKRKFYIEFFWRNAADPAEEVKRFIAYNDSLEWRTSDGRTFETPSKRFALAEMWQFKDDGHWARPDYLDALLTIWRVANDDGIEGAEVLINHKVRMEWDGRLTKWIWHVTPDARRWIEENKEMVRKHIYSFTRGGQISWNMINQ